MACDGRDQTAQLSDGSVDLLDVAITADIHPLSNSLLGDGDCALLDHLEQTLNGANFDHAPIVARCAYV